MFPQNTHYAGGVGYIFSEMDLATSLLFGGRLCIISVPPFCLCIKFRPQSPAERHISECFGSSLDLLLASESRLHCLSPAYILPLPITRPSRHRNVNLKMTSVPFEIMRPTLPSLQSLGLLPDIVLDDRESSSPSVNDAMPWVSYAFYFTGTCANE